MGKYEEKTFGQVFQKEQKVVNSFDF